MTRDYTTFKTNTILLNLCFYLYSCHQTLDNCYQLSGNLYVKHFQLQHSITIIVVVAVDETI